MLISLFLGVFYMRKDMEFFFIVIKMYYEIWNFIFKYKDSFGRKIKIVKVDLICSYGNFCVRFIFR